MSEQPDDSPREMSDDSHSTHVMTTYAEDDFEQPYEDFADVDDNGGLPGRPRRVLVNRYSALLAAVVIGGGCFDAGVRVEKGQVSSSGTSGVAGGLAGRATARSGGFPGAGAGGFGGAAAGGTSGTISSIDGDTLYITDSGGNTVKVKLSGATTLTRTVSVKRRGLYPGDSVTVSGSAGSNGTVKATSVSDSGSGGSSTGSGSASSGSTSSSTSSGSSALSSLFGG